MWYPVRTTLTLVITLSAGVQALAVPRDVNSCRRAQVAILGAGVAGLTAAEALHNASISNFLIVERNNYFGGRALHTTFGQQPDGTPYTVELGANWIQGMNQPGGPENPVWALARKHGLRTTASNYSSLLTYDEKGYNDYRVLIDEYDAAYEIASAYAGELLSGSRPDVSGRTGLALGGWRPHSDDMHRQASEWWRWDFEDAVSPEMGSLAFGATSSNVTFGDGEGDVGSLNEFVVDAEGLNKIFVKQAAEFLTVNDPRVALNTVVRNVTYSDDGVRIDMEDGSCVEAEHAICTFSLGVLQNNVVQFSPALPAWKSEAIAGFQMTTYTKIFMQFNETFWDPETQYFLYADPIERGRYPIFQSLSVPGFLDGSNILFVTTTGLQSYAVENQSDEETQAQIMEILRSMFPDKDIPEPLDFMYPRWSQDEWVVGSYSNWPVGTNLEQHRNIRANVGRLWFAGEAGSTEFYGYLHGAWFEGQEMGRRVAGILNGHCTLDSVTSEGCGSLACHEGH
ncbi:putative amine oxidase [Aspergillus flavus]|uniref:Amine oxidase n=2 Tax=Aspergillus flavus TaxID=5059 RepID=B8MXC9_ASPFN|nr:uncharacterized protein G4B84_001629 [Aspergillus flavus NRRL3357]QRD87516.1 putative amine oxidase [Aspergillus flavus]KAF7627908.1 hypothetical protein AFLA_003276 [Aspergillus flavus NRRL3357]QMW26384.1 hypothetical protein G4B84_001629 [Aspergillus flavus NRRL3357]RMZ37664.1 amine oxidase [Aspergillus flavus]UCK58939.1 hypothetical protein AFCA_001774 [Aspergillus flavus]